MTDLISRQAVMDATKTVMKDVLDGLPTTLVDGEEIYDVRTSELDFILNINKALQNAIKALPSETHDLRTETHGVCSDAISRQAVIDAIEMVDWYHQNQYKDMVSGANSDEHQAWYKAEDVYEAIEAVPSAQPERKKGKWIPVSERLPDDGKWAIWCSNDGVIGIARFKEDCYNHFYPNETSFSLENAVAWMPLPKPYGEVE